MYSKVPSFSTTTRSPSLRQSGPKIQTLTESGAPVAVPNIRSSSPGIRVGVEAPAESEGGLNCREAVEY
ncbi:hypothetical protein DSECCO2_500090 [anaerobic digester metagenome]